MGRFGRLFVVVSEVAFVSVIYEVLEWLTAVVVERAAADALPGNAGDVWDAQKDMALACAGALLAGLELASKGGRSAGAPLGGALRVGRQPRAAPSRAG